MGGVVYQTHRRQSLENPNERSYWISVELAHEAERNSSHALILRELGATVSEVRGVKHLVLPQDPRTLFDRAYRRIERLIADGRIAPEEAIWPALVFKNRVTDETLLARPRIDPVPDPKVWVLDLSLRDLSNPDYAKNIALGRSPLALAAPEHDLGHLTLFLDVPELMKTTRTFYKLNPHPTGRLYLRTLAMFENFAWVDLTQKADLYEQFRHWEEGGLSPEILKARLKSMSVLDLEIYLMNLSEASEQSVLKLGGAERDLFNSVKSQTEGFFEADSTLSRFILSQIDPSYRAAISVIDQASIANVFGQIELATQALEIIQSPKLQSRFLKVLPQSWTHDRLVDSLNRLLVETIAQVEMQIALPLRMNLSVAQFLSDSSKISLDHNSPTLRYIRDTAPHGGFLYRAYELNPID